MRLRVKWGFCPLIASRDEPRIVPISTSSAAVVFG
jgi:hypothetical protein